MLTLPLREEQRQEEWKCTLQTAHNNNNNNNNNNNLPVNLLIRQKQRIQRRTTQPKTPHNYWNRHKMGDLHIQLTANMEDHQPFQKHHCKNSIQKQQHSLTTYQTGQ